MASITVRNIKEEIHRALRVKAATHGRGTEAEIRIILENAVRSSGLIKLGSLLAEIGREVGGVDLEIERDKTPTEPMRLVSDPAVLAWIDAQNVETLYLAAISLAELRFGVAALPGGKKKEILHNSLEQRVVPLFMGRILPFDTAASI